MVDLLQLHFIVQVSIELGMRPKKILDEYLMKNRIKKEERQEKGYQLEILG
jgi:hypothetical protein